MNYDTLSQPWSQTAPENTRLPINPDHPFYYKHFPANWEFGYLKVNVTKGKKTEEKTLPVFFPEVRMERVVPGVNGVHQINGELGDPSSRLGKLRQAGYVILDPRDHDYMRVYPARYGGKKHSPKFESFRVLANKVIQDFDRKAFNRWRLELIVNGTIQIPHDHFMELMILDTKKDPLRYQHSQHIPEVKAQLELLYKKIEDMETARQSILSKGLSYYEELLNG